MATHAPADDDLLPLHDSLLQRQSQLAQRVPVAAGAVEVVDADVDRPAHQRHRVFIDYVAEVIAKALRAKGNHRNGQFRFPPAAVRTGQFR